LEFDPSYCATPNLIQVSSDLFAIAYRGTGNDGFVATVSIDGSGQIGSVADVLEFDTSDCYEPDIVRAGGDVYAIAYRGSGSDGFLSTVELTADGEITDAVIDTLEFDTSYGGEPDMLYVEGNIFGIAYRGVNDDGFLKTISIER
jgi:hypothetical protein